MVGDIKGALEFEELPWEFSDRTRAFLKIQDGCSQYCTFCIIPYARGPLKSLLPPRVMEAAMAYAKKGYKEVVLTGIHLGLYGVDLAEDINLAQIVGAVAEVPGLERIRLGSIEPTEITPELLQVMASNPKVCPHLHIPLQSGSGYILEKMNRPYTPLEFSQRIKHVRQMVSDIGITTDIMVGFPGESPEDFTASYKFVQQMGFSRLHVFPYSPRRGTPAAGFMDQVPYQTKKKRALKLDQLGRQLALNFHKKHLGLTLPVLIEHKRDGDTSLLTGYTGNYIRVVLEGDDVLQGRIVPVTITDVGEEVCQGEYTPKI